MAFDPKKYRRRVKSATWGRYTFFPWKNAVSVFSVTEETRDELKQKLINILWEQLND
jgi:hypothetical protein